MNLSRLLSRTGCMFMKASRSSTAQTSIPVRRLQTTAVSNYAERKYTKKVFTPSFGNEETARVEEVVVKRHKTESDLYLESKQQKKKVRTLSKLDKIILVKLGKYKRIEDVPDQLTYSSLERKKEVEQDMKHLFLGSAFKYVYIFEYASFFITGTILVFAIYWYNEVKKSSAADANNELSDDR